MQQREKEKRNYLLPDGSINVGDLYNAIGGGISLAIDCDLSSSSDGPHVSSGVYDGVARSSHHDGSGGRGGGASLGGCVGGRGVGGTSGGGRDLGVEGEDLVPELLLLGVHAVQGSVLEDSKAWDTTTVL
jgi:hypothetical protein